MSIVVIQTAEFEAWAEGLERSDRMDVVRVVGLLEGKGVALGTPHSTAIRGSKYAIRELRARSGNSPLRVFYAFDPSRSAVLILGGTKADKQLYKRRLQEAERIWEAHLAMGAK